MSKTIKLDFPITVDGKEIGEITMRRPKVRDAMLVETPGQTDARKELMLFANLCDLPEQAIHEIDFQCDYIKLQEAYRGFSKGKPKA